MAQIKKELLHEAKNLSSSDILTFNVPSFDTIDDIYLRFSNNGEAATQEDIESSIGKIALNINGEQVINTTAERLFDFYAMLGNEVGQNGRPANVINLNVGRLLFLLPENEDYFSWGCSNINTIQVQVYCNNTVTAVTECELTTERRNIQSSLGSYIKLISYPQQMTATGTNTVDTLPRDSNEAYLSIMAAAAGGTIAAGECVVNGVNIYDQITKPLNDMIVCSRGYAPVDGYFNYLFADRSSRGILPMQGVTELRLKTVFSEAPTANTYDLLACTIKNVPQAMLDMYNA